jgi:hypothetical protein
LIRRRSVCSAERTLSPLKGGNMSRYTLFVIVLAALVLAATAGNIIWGE